MLRGNVAMYAWPKPASCPDPMPYVTQVFNIRVAEWANLPECVGCVIHPFFYFLLRCCSARCHFFFFLFPFSSNGTISFCICFFSSRRAFAAAVKNYAPGVDYGPIGWIEKLLQTPIDDFRKRSRDLILVPYLVVRRGMTDVDQIHNVVMQWADKCGELYRLEPTRREYSNRVRSRIYEVMQSNPRIANMSLEKLKEKNPELYRQLYVPIK
jgi:Primase X